jgi:cell division protein FtsB
MAARKNIGATNAGSGPGRIPRWAPYASAIGLTLIIMLTINFRAYTEYDRESAELEQLNEKIEKLTEENLGLQEEIHYLKTDPKTVEREARKFGLRPGEEIVSKPAK